MGKTKVDYGKIDLTKRPPEYAGCPMCSYVFKNAQDERDHNRYHLREDIQDCYD